MLYVIALSFHSAPFSIFLPSTRPPCQNGISRSSTVISKGGLAAAHKPQRHHIRYKHTHTREKATLQSVFYTCGDNRFIVCSLKDSSDYTGNEFAVLNMRTRTRSHGETHTRTAVIFHGKEEVEAVKWKRADSVFSFQTRVSPPHHSPLQCRVFVCVWRREGVCVSVIKLPPRKMAITATEARHLS